MTGWTYEPWDGDTDNFAIKDEEDVRIAEVHNPYSWLGDRPDLVASVAKQTEDRARLFAAAKDTYEALKAVEWCGYAEAEEGGYVACCPYCGHEKRIAAIGGRAHDDACKLAAALAKAEGR